MINLHVPESVVHLLLLFLLFFFKHPAASHLPPIPLTLRGRRRHLGFLLAGFELLSGLYHLAGVILAGRAVPVWKAAEQLCGSPACPAPKTENSPPLTARLTGALVTFVFWTVTQCRNCTRQKLWPTCSNLKEAKPVSLLLAWCHPGDSALPILLQC